MGKIYKLLVAAAVATLACISCRDEETYAHQKEKERQNINAFIEDQGIQVISMEDFLRDTITNNPFTGPDSSKNEYVMFSDLGVYLQIIQRGNGTLMSDGDRKFFTARYYEYDLANLDTISMNLYNISPETFYCSRTSDTYTASFISGTMFSKYGSAVPSGWLITMPYIKPNFVGENASSKVRLIISHNQGTQSAALSVNPRFYEITIKSEKWQ